MKIRSLLIPGILITCISLSCSWERKCMDGDCENGTGVCMYPEHYLYKGTFRNGMRSGHGTLEKTKNFDWTPFIQETKYTGEWKNDKRHGRGTSFYFHGQVAYEGEWEKGERHGYGTSWDYEGEKLYSGEWKEHRRHGTGTTWLHGYPLYSGQWKDGLKHGRGTLREYEFTRKIDYDTGIEGLTAKVVSEYTGGFRENHKNGPGTLILYSNGKKTVKKGTWEEDVLTSQQ